jgi:hypothetical protein
VSSVIDKQMETDGPVHYTVLMQECESGSYFSDIKPDRVFW